MTAAALLNDLRTRGVEVQADGGRLRFKPADRVPPELVADLREHKAELLTLLDPSSTTEPKTHADREWRRFLAVCRHWPNSRGWYDPGSLADDADRAYLAWLNEPQERTDAYKMTRSATRLYQKPGGGWETFTGRAARYLQECDGLPPGTSRQALDI